MEIVTEEIFSKKNNLYFAFVHLEIPSDVIWWVLKKLDVEGWLIKIVQSMYRNAQSSDAPGRGRITSGLAIIPLLFITMLESLSREIRS